MCNFIKTLLATVLHSAWPEFSIAFGEKNTARMSDLYYKSIKVSVFGAVAISIGLLIFGPWIYSVWTHGQIPFNYSLMIAFLVVLIVNTFWNSGLIALIATNNHIEVGILDVTSAFLSIIVAIILARVTHNVATIVYSTLIIDVVLTFYVHRKFKKILLAISHA